VSVGDSGLVHGSRANLWAIRSAIGYWWEVPAAAGPLLTLNGSNVVSLVDRISGVPATQADPLAQPEHHASGGPGDIPYTAFQDVDRFLAATISNPAGSRVGIYAVVQIGGTSGRSVLWARSGASYGLEFYNGAGSFAVGAGFTGGDQFVSATTSPPFDSSWHLLSLRPLATGARFEIDGVLASPSVTGADTLKAMTTQVIGGDGNAGGALAMLFHVDAPDDGRDAIVKSYVRWRTKLPIA